MAMSKEALGKAIADLIIDENAPSDMKQKITSQWTDIAGAIIDEIKKSTIVVAAAIPVSVNTSSGTGATTATGSATIS